ncbi:phenylalanine--tRNA ligase subunit beta [Candidatus Collierbacteria bacterium]|nr:phenylalanine--tRNA ligase subunit beta [Candidatus Collierbacteria bacterium]
MLIPKPWLQKLVDLNGISDQEFAEKMTFAGNKVESVQKHKNGIVFEFEITSNRPDTLSVIGIAREAAAIFGRELKLPKLTKTKLLKRQPIALKVKDKNLCPAYSTVEISSIKVKPSGLEIRNLLEMSGIRPVNNIVDITNFLMLETGQPMHAFDADKIKGRLTLRSAEKDEKIIPLDHKPRILSGGEIIIEDEEKLVDLAGLMGGLNTEISDSTVKVYLLVPIYSPINIRRAGKFLKLRSEASTRFEKKIDLTQTENVTLQALDLISKGFGGKQSSAIKTVIPAIKPTIISFSPQILEKYTGLVLTEKEISKILLKVGICSVIVLRSLVPSGTGRSRIPFSGTRLIDGRRGNLVFQPPFWRRDLSIPADLIEETVRLYGYNNLKKTLPAGEIPVNSDALAVNYDRKLRQLIAIQGYTETYASTLIGKNLIEKLKMDPENHLKVLHPMSSDFEYMRYTTAETIIPAVEANLATNTEFSIFELGTVFYPGKSDQLPPQPQELTIATNCKSYEQVKGDLEFIFNQLSLNLSFEPIKNDPSPFLHPFKQAKIVCDAEIVGSIGWIHPEIIPGEDDKIIFAVINISAINSKFDINAQYPKQYKYSPIIEDITLVVPPNTMIGKIIDQIKNTKLVASVSISTIWQNSLTVNVEFNSDARQLTQNEANQVKDKIIAGLSNEFNVSFKTGE